MLILTRYGIPVSTTFLILTSFTATALPAMLVKSIVGYLVAFGVGLVVYLAISKLFYSRILASRDREPARYWVALQWISTGFLWSQWLVQDLANIFAYLPRKLDMSMLIFALVVMLALHAYLFYRRGGAIQGIVTSKTNTQDIRSATLIDFAYALILIFFKELSNVPMSTTWVFLGLLAGREIGLVLMLKVTSLNQAGRTAASDMAKALAGLIVSIAVAFAMPYLAAYTGGFTHDHAHPVTVSPD